jgi:carbon storage regulator CsrA
MVVSGIEKNTVKIGFDAPKSVSILREEVKVKQAMLAKLID